MGDGVFGLGIGLILARGVRFRSRDAVRRVDVSDLACPRAVELTRRDLAMLAQVLVAALWVLKPQGV